MKFFRLGTLTAVGTSAAAIVATLNVSASQDEDMKRLGLVVLGMPLYAEAFNKLGRAMLNPSFFRALTERDASAARLMGLTLLGGSYVLLTKLELPVILTLVGASFLAGTLCELCSYIGSKDNLEVERNYEPPRPH